MSDEVICLDCQSPLILEPVDVGEPMYACPECHDWFLAEEVKAAAEG